MRLKLVRLMKTKAERAVTIAKRVRSEIVEL